MSGGWKRPWWDMCQALCLVPAHQAATQLCCATSMQVSPGWQAACAAWQANLPQQQDPAALQVLAWPLCHKPSPMHQAGSPTDHSPTMDLQSQQTWGLGALLLAS